MAAKEISVKKYVVRLSDEERVALLGAGPRSRMTIRTADPVAWGASPARVIGRAALWRPFGRAVRARRPDAAARLGGPRAPRRDFRVQGGLNPVTRQIPLLHGGNAKRTGCYHFCYPTR